MTWKELEELEAGGERFLVAERGEALMAFGIGPRDEDGRSRPDRVANLIEDGSLGMGAARWCTQVHGKVMASLSPEPGEPFSGVGDVGRCDGLLTAEAGLGLGVWTADCVPVLLAGGGAVAAVHSGWRGTAVGVVPRAVERLWLEFGVRVEQLHVGLGPAIGRCCYEVGGEVVEALAERGVPEDLWLSKQHVDLRALIRAELEGLGVTAERIELVGGCTACEPSCASYRRDGESAGRQLSVVVLRT